jgi:DNA polymerase I
MSKDPKFMEIFLTGGDPHGDVARRCGISRKEAKVMNFGVLYGMGPEKYMKTFGVTKERALQMIDDYHRTYDGFARWKTATENYAKKHGEVRNLFGRRRLLSEAAKNPYSGVVDKRKYFAELRYAVNTIIQGTGADIVKRATIAMCNEFERRNLDAHFLLQVHDEVLIEARIDQMFEIEQVVVNAMEHTTELDVPLIADGKILAKWGEMKDDSVVSLPFRLDYSLLSGIL